ncbi:methyl-accepting chemotaxis protein [Acidovorax sp. LjRoot194]|uniref:methyl-accepting chemotaxis protein n=1 Tax=Acidovorax sp. LjRoot194 TaxID=3342280 RepID=UPI003ED130F1
MNKLSLAQRLTLINGSLICVLMIAAVIVWFMMAKVTEAADRVNLTNVPQLLTIGELELNVTRTSLQLRHAILARTPAELDEALSDVGAKKKLLLERLDHLGKNMIDEEGRQAFAPLPALMTEFWAVGEENVKLIQAGKKEEAFAFLVDKTIPARNRLLQPLAAEKSRQGSRLAYRIDEIKSLASLDRNIVISVMAGIALALLGLSYYLRGVVRQLGADPHALKHVAQAVADGDLARAIRVREGDSESAMAALATMSHRLSDAVRTVRHNADSVAAASQEIANGNHDLSARTEHQASTLQQTSATMEQLSSAVRQNADNASEADRVAGVAATVASDAGSVVQEVVKTMKGIHDSSQKISEIIGVIDGIAFQTNILALNAAVEAARAGEQGRGFAVVASEVRSLAQRSAQAAKEIKNLIDTSVSRVAHGSGLVNSAGTTMGEAVTAIHKVSELVASISSACRSQHQEVSQVVQAVVHMDAATQQNAALVEQMSAAALSLSTQSQELVHAVSVFRLEHEPA